jgi:hypothetical protein
VEREAAAERSRSALARIISAPRSLRHRPRVAGRAGALFRQDDVRVAGLRGGDAPPLGHIGNTIS